MTSRDIVALACAALIVAGVALIHPPAALITAGLLGATLLLADLEPRSRA